VTKDTGFLEDAAHSALTWMQYQSPDDTILIAQQPTSDWRDEQWVWGYGLFVNALYYACLRLYDKKESAQSLRALVNHVGVRHVHGNTHIHEGLSLAGKPHFALYVYKQHISERFDLLGNSLAILFGLADKHRAKEIIAWVETTCDSLRFNGDLACDLPPCFFPYIRPEDPDWLPRYAQFNRPGEYHNGGIWPFVCGFYIAALVCAGEHELAQRKFTALSEIVKLSQNRSLAFGFNEWLSAQDCKPRGQDWQTWSAAIYLYAAACVETRTVPFFF
jgi:hypothetical protein